MNEVAVNSIFLATENTKQLEQFYKYLDLLNKLLNNNHIKKSLDIYINNRCNVLCSFCVGKHSSQTSQSIINNFVNIIRYIKLNYNQYDEFYITGGGEPLLDFELVQAIISAAPQKTININTNGTLLMYSGITDFFNKNKNCKLFLNFQGLNEIWRKQNPLYFKVITDQVNFTNNIKKLKDQITVKIIVTSQNHQSLKFLIEDIFFTFGITQFQVQPNYIEPDLPYLYTELQNIPNVNITFDSKCDLDMNIITYKHDKLLTGKRCEACIINNNDILNLDDIINDLMIITNYIQSTCIECPAFLKLCTPCYCHFTTFRFIQNNIRFSNCQFYNKIYAPTINKENELYE